MPILNYTTEVEAAKTVGEIHAMLAKAGARKIMNEYDGSGYITTVSFAIDLNGQEIMFRLPSDWRPVLKVMEGQRGVPKRMLTEGQSIRVAWRIVHTWVKAQLAIIETKMVRVEQVFLPYATDSRGETLYEKLIKSPDKLLGSGE